MLIGETTYRLDSECNICDRFYNYHPNFDSGNGSDYSEALGSAFYPPNTQGSAAERELSFASFHPGGANIVLCDASTRLVSEDIDINIWRAIASRAGGEVVGEY
jgi:hypothetical protein